MRNRLWVALILGVTAGVHAPAGAAFSSRGTQTLSASVTVSRTAAGSGLSIHADTLPTQALFGSNFEVPVTIVNSAGPVNPNNLQVAIFYQLLDVNGATLNPPTQVPIPFVPGPASGNILQGTAIIRRSDLLPIQQGGSVTYVFQARLLASGSGTLLTNSGQAPALSNIASLASLAVLTPFKVTIRDPWCDSVGPAGARVSASDLAAHDGGTAVSLGPGIVLAPGTLCIHVENPDALPPGPGRTKAAAVYTVTLENTSLSGTAQLVLSYPADTSGKVLDLGSDPGSLGIYWLDRANLNGEWRALSQASLDSTLHTLTGTTGHFSTFGLFPAGAIGSADLRPPERIITPNGDGINDTAVFGNGIDQVRIFDARGRRVRTIPGPSPVWDGTDDDGRIVASGVYIYQYTINGDRVSGVIGVAK